MVPGPGTSTGSPTRAASCSPSWSHSGNGATPTSPTPTARPPSSSTATAVNPCTPSSNAAPATGPWLRATSAYSPDPAHALRPTAHDHGVVAGPVVPLHVPQRDRDHEATKGSARLKTARTTAQAVGQPVGMRQALDRARASADPRRLCFTVAPYDRSTTGTPGRRPPCATTGPGAPSPSMAPTTWPAGSAPGPGRGPPPAITDGDEQAYPMHVRRRTATCRAGAGKNAPIAG